MAAIVEVEGGEATEMRKWYSEDGDVRDTLEIIEEAVAFFDEFDVRSVAMPEKTIGCPHEEDIDYEGPVCPKCPFWANRDRWTGEVTH